MTDPSTGLITQTVRQKSSGRSFSTHNGLAAVSDTFEYPLGLDITYKVLPSISSQTFYDYGVYLDHSYIRKFVPPMGARGTTITTQQRCDGTQVSRPMILKAISFPS